MTTGNYVRIGEVLRTPSPRQPDRERVGVGEERNFYYVTRPTLGGAAPHMPRGINTNTPIKCMDGSLRRPAFYIRSNPHRAGTAATPWEDFLDPDNGHARYFGDAKASRDLAASEFQGNALLLAEHAIHSGLDAHTRMQATPLLFFKGIPGTTGLVEFQGLAVIHRVEHVVQWDEARRKPFTNFRYDCVFLDLSDTEDAFDWEWINARRDPAKSLKKTHALAPKAWKTWVSEGQEKLATLRRRVFKPLIIPPSQQKPALGSDEERILQGIYAHYRERGQHKFEGLAELVTERMLRRSGQRYITGWVTRGSGDGGADFVGRLDVGEGNSVVKIIVLGQAKCEGLATATSGTHIARTVARLRRGWMGAYVTTSFFSPMVQLEVIEDEYPLLLVHGLQVASVVREQLSEMRATLDDYLVALDDKYPSRVRIRNPSEILLE